MTKRGMFVALLHGQLIKHGAYGSVGNGSGGVLVGKGGGGYRGPKY